MTLRLTLGERRNLIGIIYRMYSVKITKIHLLSFLILIIQGLITSWLIKLASSDYELIKFGTNNSLDINILIYGIGVVIVPIVALIILGELKVISDRRKGYKK